jgi:hypothetical protein
MDASRLQNDGFDVSVHYFKAVVSEYMSYDPDFAISSFICLSLLSKDPEREGEGTRCKNTYASTTSLYPNSRHLQSSVSD